MESFDNVFAIACDSYGLNSKQIDNLIESSNVVSDSINGWNDNNRDLYIRSYQTLAQVLGSGQKNGIFNLETASRLFCALISVKNYLLDKTHPSNLEEDNQFIRLIIQKKILSKCIYNQTDLKRINLALESIEATESDACIDIDAVSRGYNIIHSSINSAQSRGKFTLQQADGIMKLLTSLKQKILNYKPEDQRPRTVVLPEKLHAPVKDVSLIEKEIL